MFSLDDAIFNNHVPSCASASAPVSVRSSPVTVPVNSGEEQSLALAQMLMEQEAMESYALSAGYLRDNADQYSPEDLEALQAVLQENEEDEAEAAGYYEDEESLSGDYDLMLRLGECIGDVKQERWALQAREFINALERFKFDQRSTEGLDQNDSRCKCLVCLFPYQQNDELRKLPCGHCFHVDCIDHWLVEKDFCPYCRQPITEDY